MRESIDQIIDWVLEYQDGPAALAASSHDPDGSSIFSPTRSTKP
jgi:hypothetical protein